MGTIIRPLGISLEICNNDILVVTSDTKRSTLRYGVDIDTCWTSISMTSPDSFVAFDHNAATCEIDLAVDAVLEEYDERFSPRESITQTS